jgi:signal transduction histidine kinase
MRVPLISLERRLTLLVLALLCLCGGVAGITFYGSIHRAQEMELNRRLDVRLASLAAAISVSSVEGGQIKLHRRPEPEDAAPLWRIATSDGTELWASEGWSQGRSMVERSEVLVFGDRSLPPVKGASIVSREEHAWEQVPPAVRRAAELTVPGLVIDRVERTREGGTVVYQINGRDRRRERVLAIDADGRVIKVVPGNWIDPESASVLPRYRLTGKPGRIELVIMARTSSAGMEYVLARLAWSLKMIGPLALLLTGALLAALIRWQLRPLARMAEQASRIGPGSPAERIGPVGSNTECVQLRDAINGMLERLAEGLEREHRFASTAAHELRTPLAQLRTTIEVALRRDRDADEYRAALAETLDDVERLQKLVLGLLHLARSAEHFGMASGRPVVLASLLEKAGRDHGPAFVGGRVKGDEVAVEGDEDLFLAALGNVLENAAHHAPEAPATIRVEDAGASVRLVVADHGPGIAAADRERIFEPLTRLRPARLDRDAADGFGLGLAVARAAARAYGGDLACRGRSDGDPGAEFVFSFRKAPRD